MDAAEGAQDDQDESAANIERHGATLWQATGDEQATTSWAVHLAAPTVLLQRLDGERPLPQRLDGRDRRADAGERGEVWDAVHERLAADAVAVLDGLLAAGGVEDQVDLAVGDLRLGEGARERVVEAHHLAGRAHLGAEDGVGAREAVEGEDGFLHAQMLGDDRTLDALLRQRLAHSAEGGDLGPGDAG